MLSSLLAVSKQKHFCLYISLLIPHPGFGGLKPVQLYSGILLCLVLDPMLIDFTYNDTLGLQLFERRTRSVQGFNSWKVYNLLLLLNFVYIRQENPFRPFGGTFKQVFLIPQGPWFRYLLSWKLHSVQYLLFRSNIMRTHRTCQQAP